MSVFDYTGGHEARNVCARAISIDLGEPGRLEPGGKRRAPAARHRPGEHAGTAGGHARAGAGLPTDERHDRAPHADRIDLSRLDDRTRRDHKWRVRSELRAPDAPPGAG